MSTYGEVKSAGVEGKLYITEGDIYFFSFNCGNIQVRYRYDNIDELIEVCVKHMSNEEFPPEEVRKYMKGLLPQLNYWKRYSQFGENEFCNFKRKLVEEINELKIDGMPKVDTLYSLEGNKVNLEYRLPNGQYTKFLNDNGGDAEEHLHITFLTSQKQNYTSV